MVEQEKTNRVYREDPPVDVRKPGGGGKKVELELKLSDEKDANSGWNFDPACLEKIRYEYRKRNGDLQTADIEFIDDILSIVWEAGLLEVDGD